MSDNKKKKVNRADGAGKGGGGFERLKRKNSARLFRRRVFYTSLFAVLLCVCLIGIVAIFFRVHAITVKGNTIYNEGDIVNASGIKQDMNIYLINDKSVVTRILAQFPYVRTVEVDRVIPSGITLTLNCDDPNYYMDIEGEYFILSRDLRVLNRFKTLDELKTAHPEAKKLVGGEVSRAIVGSEMVFVNTAYSETAKELLAILEASEIFAGVSSVDFSDRFNMQVVYDSRIKANIGNNDETALKLRFMNEILKDLGEARGTIDIKDVEAAYVLLNSDAVYD